MRSSQQSPPRRGRSSSPGKRQQSRSPGSMSRRDGSPMPAPTRKVSPIPIPAVASKGKQDDSPPVSPILSAASIPGALATTSSKVSSSPVPQRSESSSPMQAGPPVPITAAPNLDQIQADGRKFGPHHFHFGLRTDEYGPERQKRNRKDLGYRGDIIQQYGGVAPELTAFGERRYGRYGKFDAGLAKEVVDFAVYKSKKYEERNPSGKEKPIIPIRGAGEIPIKKTSMKQWTPFSKAALEYASGLDDGEISYHLDDMVEGMPHVFDKGSKGVKGTPGKIYDAYTSHELRYLQRHWGEDPRQKEEEEASESSKKPIAPKGKRSYPATTDKPEKYRPFQEMTRFYHNRAPVAPPWTWADPQNPEYIGEIPLTDLPASHPRPAAGEGPRTSSKSSRRGRTRVKGRRNNSSSRSRSKKPWTPRKSPSKSSQHTGRSGTPPPPRPSPGGAGSPNPQVSEKKKVRHRRRRKAKPPTNSTQGNPGPGGSGSTQKKSDGNAG